MKVRVLLRNPDGIGRRYEVVEVSADTKITYHNGLLTVGGETFKVDVSFAVEDQDSRARVDTKEPKGFLKRRKPAH